jgi:hypothetical protein
MVRVWTTGERGTSSATQRLEGLPGLHVLAPTTVFLPAGRKTVHLLVWLMPIKDDEPKIQGLPHSTTLREALTRATLFFFVLAFLRWGTTLMLPEFRVYGYSYRLRNES